MHEAAFEMIEIPHVSYSRQELRRHPARRGRHGPLLHEGSTSTTSSSSAATATSRRWSASCARTTRSSIGAGREELEQRSLIENCDEFIYYDDLVRARRAAKHGKQKKKNRPKEQPRGEDRKDGPAAAAAQTNGEDVETRRQEGLDHLLDVVEALFEDRDTHLWGSMVKQTLKRKRPNFSERFHGYRTFTELLEDAEKRGLLELSKDERSGGYIITSFGPNA